MTTSETQVKHTPGPWAVDERGDVTGVVDSRGFSIASADETGILTTWEETGARHWSDRPGETFVERGEEEAAANARLIAAAPALRGVVLELLDIAKSDDWNGSGRLDDALEDARAAVAAASGS